MIWAKTLSGSRTEWSGAFSLDPLGNIVVTGKFKGCVDFDPGPAVACLTSNTNSQMFLAKYDANGAYQWAKQIGGNGYLVCHSIAIDKHGNLYATGNFQGSVDFDPGEGEAMLVSKKNTDIFLAKYSPDGSYLWVRQMGSENDDYSAAVTSDPSGGILLTGHFQYHWYYDQAHPATHLKTNGGTDIFLAKFDDKGRAVWAKGIGGQFNDHANGIQLDAEMNIHIIGYFSSTCDFDPGKGTAMLSPKGEMDAFIAKFNSSGSYKWVQTIGGEGSTFGYSIAISTSDEIYVSGRFQGPSDFDPGCGSNILATSKDFDLFVAKYASMETEQGGAVCNQSFHASWYNSQLPCACGMIGKGNKVDIKKTASTNATYTN